MSPTGDGLLCGGLKMVDPSTGFIKWGVPLGFSDQALQTLVFSPDGSQIAGVYNYQLNIWRASDGALLNTIGSGLDDNAYAAWSPDGSRLVLGSSAPGEAEVMYLTSTWTTMGSFKSPDGTFIGFGEPAFSPDGTVIATGTYPYGQIAFWNASDGSFIKSVAIPTTFPEPSLAWISNSTLIFNGSVTYSLDYGTLAINEIYSGGTSRVSTSFDRSLITLAANDNLDYDYALLRMSDFSQLWSSTGAPYGWGCPAISPDDSRMFVPYMLTVLNTSDFSVLGQWAAHYGYSSGAVETPSGRLVVSAGSDGKLMFWDQASGAPLYSSSSANIINCLTVSPDSSVVASGGGYALEGGPLGVLDLWNVSDGSLLRTFSSFSRFVYNLAFSPDGQTLYASGIDSGYGAVKALKVSDGTQLWARQFNLNSGGMMCVSLDGSTIAVYDSGAISTATTLWVLKASTGQVLWSAAAGSVNSCAFSPDGSKLVVIGTLPSNHVLNEFNSASGSLIGYLKTPTDFTYSVAFSPDGQTFACEGSWANVVILRASDLHVLGTYGDGTNGGTSSLAYSSDGRNLLYGAGAGDVVCALNPNYVPLTPTSVSVTPSTITGPQATGTVTIAYPAPYGGATVALASTNTAAATVPATVVVPQAATSATFPVANANTGVLALNATIEATLGGTTQSAAVQANPIVLAGSVTLGDYGGSESAVAVTVDVRSPGTTTALESHTVNLASNGGFQVPTRLVGTFDVAVKGSHWLRRVLKNVSISTTGATGLSASLINGDVNGDNTVNLADLVAIAAAWRSTSGASNWNPNADLNGDGVVNLSDWMIVARNWRQSGDR
jgi:WD40 repeat protein